MPKASMFSRATDRSTHRSLAVIAERIVRLYASEHDLILFKPPINLPEFTISVLTSAARADDAALQWLQQQVMHVSESNIWSNSLKLRRLDVG
jgi:hypothetical protein